VRHSRIWGSSRGGASAGTALGPVGGPAGPEAVLVSGVSAAREHRELFSQRVPAADKAGLGDLAPASPRARYAAYQRSVPP